MIGVRTMMKTPLLIIDDEPAVLEGLQEFLEDEGYEVYPAQGGREALALFRKKRPELVLTDLKMPDLPGIEVIREIRNMGHLTPVVVVTGYGTLDVAIDAIRLDVFDFLTKPVELDRLKETLDRARREGGETLKVRRELSRLRDQVGRLQRHLWQEQQKLFDAEPLIQTGRLAAGLLHELNNPLSFILGHSELLQIFHPEVENVKKIHEQAARMNALISDLMERLRQSRERRLEWLDVNQLLREEAAFLAAPFQGIGGVELEWRLDENLPRIKGCISDFRQVFGNLLRNALDAMAECATRRLVLASSCDVRFAHVRVKDSGPGIPAPIREKVFDPFFTTKTGRGSLAGGLGMGIGLHHCRELLKSYGGTIDLESPEEGGACFHVVLPLDLGAEAGPLKTVP